MKNEIALKTVYWASVSGGKDSLYMLKIILENPEKYSLHGIVHFELDIDYPFIKDVIQKMQRMVEPLKIPFLIFRPRITFEEYYEKYGFPTFTRRWCNLLKQDCSKQLDEYLLTRGEKRIYYIGFCADEEKRFRDDGNIYPLAEKGIIESTILEWAKHESIFNNYYEYNKRCGCYMCPMATLKEDMYLSINYPDLYAKKMYLAYQTELKVTEKCGKPFSIWSNIAKYNTEYRMSRIAQKIKEGDDNAV